jgi:hypothetical protein
MPLSRIVVLGALVGATSASLAAAQPLPSNSGAECVSTEALLAVLRSRGLPIDQSGLRLRIEQSVGNGARHTLHLESTAGAAVLERTIESADCGAVLKAFAVVVEGYFVDVGTLNQHGEEPSPNQVPAAPTAATAPAPAAVAAPVAEPAAQPRVVAAEPPQGATHVGEAAGSNVDRGAWESRFQGLGGVGAELLSGSAALAVAAQVGAGFAWPVQRAFAHLVLGTSAATTLGVLPNRVSRWPSRLVLRGGLSSRSVPQLEGWLGVGVAVARVHALDLAEAPVHTSWSPLFLAGAALGFDVSRLWAFQADLSCGLLAVRERYSIAPDGEIGRGPSVTCSLVGNFRFSRGATDQTTRLGPR